MTTQRQNDEKNKSVSRRRFLKTTSAVLAASAIPSIGNSVFAAGQQRLKVALIGCGKRGKVAIGNFIEAARHLDIKADVVAIADYFKEPAIGVAARFGLPQENCHAGAKAYMNVMASDADVVLLVTPPNFRPVHFEAAIKAGKHVFMEKPAAVDAPGARRIIKAGELAEQKKLSVVAGTMKRHDKSYIETQYAVANGAIGDIRAGKVWWCEGGR